MTRSKSFRELVYTVERSEQNIQFRKNSSFSRLHTSWSTITATAQVTHTATRYIVIVDANAQSNPNITRCSAKGNRLPLQYRVSVQNIYSNISTVPCSNTPRNGIHQV